MRKSWSELKSCSEKNSILDDIPRQARKSGNKKGNKREYKDVCCAFDIETTLIDLKNGGETEKHAIMYLWQFALGKNLTVYGRTWAEWTECMDWLKEHSGGMYYVVYVHNLAYEFQFLSGLYAFDPETMLLQKERRPIKADLKDYPIEFRCSAILSNMSLAKFLESMQVPAQKGELDYSVKRYPWTQLKDNELDYGMRDVEGLVQAIVLKMEHDGDDLYSIPLTSTGYLRRETRKALQPQRLLLQNLRPTRELYELLSLAFRGGNTHANRYFTGRILTNVKSADRSSSYPGVMMNAKYPITPFRKVDAPDINKLSTLLWKRGRACLFTVIFYSIRLRDDTWGCPYLSYSKTECGKVIELDNGRILEAEICKTTITDIDFKIILEEYEWDDMEIETLWYSTYGELPDELKGIIRYYYTKKTELKNVAGEEYYYMKSKNIINSAYGMTAQDPGKKKIYYSENVSRETSVDKLFHSEPLTDEEFKQNVERAVMPYQWGVWVTAWARYELEIAIRSAHEQGSFVYCDTDAVYYLGEVDLTEYNREKEKLSKKTGACAADKKGIMHYMEVYEQEEEKARFLTWGAKKYAYEDMEGKLHITIAGVPKKRGAEKLASDGGLEVLKPGYTFRGINKLRASYNDDINKKIRIDGHTLTVTRNVALLETEYKMSLSTDYKRLLEDLGELRLDIYD